MDGVILRLLDYLVAAIDRAVARGWEAEADALGQLYQATGAALDLDAVAPGRIQAALEGLRRVSPHRARAIRPTFECLITGLEGGREKEAV